MSTVSVEIKFDSNFIVGLSENELGNVDVVLRYGRVSINTTNETAFLDGYSGERIPTVSVNNGIYTWVIQNLPLNSYYYFEITVNDVIETMYFVNTSDSRTYHSLQVKVIDSKNQPIEGALVKVEEDDDASPPRWLDHLQGFPLPDPYTPAELYTHLTNLGAPPWPVVFSVDTPKNGEVLIQGLERTTWDIEVSKAGKITRTGSITFPSGDMPTVATRTYKLENE